MAVFVLDQHCKPLMPCTEKRARLLLERGAACVHRLVPFVIRLKSRTVDQSDLQPLRLKLDPGSKATGVALVRSINADQSGITALNLFELIHRGKQISEALTARSAMRRRRRGNLRYRAPRFLNRGNKQEGWLAPSLQHRVDTTLSWVNNILRWAPVCAISCELVKFDMQCMENPDIEGIQYQQGTLQGYEIREYLLEKFHRKCAYCDKADVPLQVEHMDPQSKSGSSRVANLTISCKPCNQLKNNRPLSEFLKQDQTRLKRLLTQAKAPLRDAAAVNATRWALVNALKATGLPVETASGGQTKFNRKQLGIPKEHALDAVCVGAVTSVQGWQKPTLMIKCTGRGSYQRTRLNQYGFPRAYLTRQKSVFGFQTGDMVKAVVIKGTKIGTYTGRVAVRSTGNFNIQMRPEIIQGISYKYCKVIQRNDGYGYSLKARQSQTALLSLTDLKGDVSRRKAR